MPRNTFFPLCFSGLLIFASWRASAIEAPSVWEPPAFEEPLASDNPYVAKARAIVEALYVRGVKPSPSSAAWNDPAFWLTWGFTAPESLRRGEPELGRAARSATEAWIARLKEKPSGYWALIPALQTVEFWRKSGGVPEDVIRRHLEDLHGSVEACYASQKKAGEWISTTPNTLHQAAAALVLAATVYEAAGFRAAEAGVYREAAARCVRLAEKLRLPGGAFSYMPGTGADSTYYNFDAVFLGIYYLYTRDPGARASLAAMAEWSRSIGNAGYGSPFSSPWWKHSDGRNGVYWGGAVLAGLSGDPVTESVMGIRRRWQQNYYHLYYAMRFHRPIPNAPVDLDRCAFDRNANGPALRRGDFDVEMPFRSRGESTLGASWIGGDPSARHAVVAMTLAPLRERPEADAARHGIVGRLHGQVLIDENARRHALIGTDWIAHAVSYRPAWGIWTTEERDAWRRVDLHYADADGATGLVNLLCLQPTASEGVALYVRTGGGPFQAQADGTLASDKLALNAKGDLGSWRKVETPQKSLVTWVADVSGADKRDYRAGEQFSVSVSIRRQDSPAPVIDGWEHHGDLWTLRLSKGGKPLASLVYHDGDAPLAFPCPAGKRLWTAPTGDDTRNTVDGVATIRLNPGALALITDSAK